MTAESTDIAVFKQLVLVWRYVTGSGVKTSFLCITDMRNDTADTIEGTMLKYLDEKFLH